MMLQKPTSSRGSKRKHKGPVLFFCAFNNPAHVRSKRNLFLWSDSFLKLLKTQRKQHSCSSSFGNKRKKFSLPLRYATKSVKIKSTKRTFRLDSTKRNYILTAVVPWHRSSSTLPVVGRYFSMQLASSWFEQAHYPPAHIIPRTGTTQDPQSSVSVGLAEVKEKWAHFSGAGV